MKGALVLCPCPAGLGLGPQRRIVFSPWEWAFCSESQRLSFLSCRVLALWHTWHGFCSLYTHCLIILLLILSHCVTVFCWPCPCFPVQTVHETVLLRKFLQTWVINLCSPPNPSFLLCSFSYHWFSPLKTLSSEPAFLLIQVTDAFLL